MGRDAADNGDVFAVVSLPLSRVVSGGRFRVLPVVYIISDLI